MLFSVVIPLYNKAPWVEAAIGSVLGQRWPDLEVIVVDDGSTDDGARRVEAIADPRVRLIRQANAGASAARNRGIEEATGDYVAFLDADDWWMPEYLATLADLIERFPGCGLYATNYYYFRDDPLVPVRRNPPGIGPAPQLVDRFFERWSRAHFFCTCSVAIPLALLRESRIRFPEGEQLGEDQDVWFRIAERWPVAYVARPLVGYRRGLEQSLSQGTADDMLPHVRRLEARYRSGALPAVHRRGVARLLGVNYVSLARHLLLRGRRRRALAFLFGNTFGVRTPRYWLRVCTAAFMPSGMARSFLGPDSGDADGDAPPPATARLLFATPEPWPTFRADVAVLFGKYLPRFGVATDLVAERAPGTDGAGWGGGRAYLASTGGGKARRQLATFVHCVRMLMRADPRECRALQVRDMPFVAAFGVLAARWKKLPFFYWMSFPLPEAQVKLARARGMSAGLARFLSPWVRGHAGLVVLYRFVLPLADHVFVQSEWMLREVASKGIAPERMTAVPMGVDLEAARPEDIAPSDDPRIAGRPLVVYLGVLYRDRGIDLLFEMLQRVRARFPDVLLALVGQAEDEQHEEWLRERAAQLGVAESVVWTGWLPVEEAWRYVRAAHVGLSPIPRGPLLDQASPTKVLEYLALGLAVVASDLPDQKLVLEESGGGICVALSAENLADAVCELLADPQRRSDMARRGRAYVRERRSYRQLAQALAEKYGTLVHPDAEGRLQAAAVTPRRP